MNDENDRVEKAADIGKTKKLAAAEKTITSQRQDKRKQAAELVIANRDLAFENKEKGKRAAELVIANKELVFRNEEKEKLTAELHNLAFYDPLTGLPNRRLLLDRLHHALAISVRSGFEGAVMFVDLDRFKDINDTLGHAFGDLLLIQTAERLQSCLRKGDTVARLGGDEFVVVLVGLSKRRVQAAVQAKEVGDRILAALTRTYHIGARELDSTPSIGATLFSETGEVAEELLKRADIAMYQAKKAGGNNLKFFNQEMQDVINARVQLDGELSAAIENEQFTLYYQVMVNESRAPLGAEALIRWIHPERGRISPDQFIPLAEDTGLILPIGSWVLETACAQLGEWRKDALTRDLNVSVNVSTKQLYLGSLITQVRSLVDRHGIDPAQLTLEINENMLLEGFDEAIVRLTELKDIGVRISLDDFGTGYSSLQYLKRLPIDELKIDMSFVRDIATDRSDQAIARAIVAVATSLGLDVIAEGVETEEQLRCLRDVGCTNFQGYLFGRPMPIGEFDAHAPGIGPSA